MPAYTLQQLRCRLTSTVFPDGADDCVKTERINRARERLFNTTNGGGWKGGDATITLSIQADVNGNQFVTLPFGSESIVGVYGTGGDYNLQNEWFEFTRAAPGLNGTSNAGRNTMADLGSGFNTFLDIPDAGLQPVFTTEGPATITLVGFNMIGDFISEVILFLAAGTQSSINTYKQIVSLEIDPQVNCFVTAGVLTQAPTGFLDFSMFPTLEAPTQGFYMADDGTSEWVLDTSVAPIQWRKVNLISA